MQPFVVHITFSTPICLTIPPTLDAILAAELALHVGDARALAELPLQTTDGVYHASQLYLDAINLEHAFTKIAMRQTEPASMPITSVRGNARGDMISIAYNKYKNTLNRHRARSVMTGVFAGVGDIDEIESILTDVLAIGARRADGYGLIADRSIEPVDADPRIWGIMDSQGEPMRPVPLRTWATLGGAPDALVQMVRARPWYWDARNPAEICAVPASDTMNAFLAGMA